LGIVLGIVLGIPFGVCICVIVIVYLCFLCKIRTRKSPPGEILSPIANLDPQQITFDIQYPTERRNSVNSYL
jgi:hypothetical protein